MPLETNRLYYGDCLPVMQEHLPDACVDLVYLDPPFNSKRDYNLLFKSPKGHHTDASITAFEDSWHWGDQAAEEHRQILRDGPAQIGSMVEAFRAFLGENDMVAYLVMMARRLLEIHRVLKPAGSIYLHCDPTASHYLKILMDAVFGAENFRNEIIWKRKTGRGETNHPSSRFGNCTDTIFFYAKSPKNLFHAQFNKDAPGYQNYVESHFRHTDKKGRKYRIDNLASPSPRPNLMYEYKGYRPPKKGWAISKEKMEQWEAEGRLHFPKDKNGRIQRIRYLDEVEGKPVQNLWDDIEMVSPHSPERLGYPTQKPLALLERIIQASSNPGDVVLDPFCGCGTAIHAAQKLNRLWMGIDITHLAVSLIERRLKDSFPGISFEVLGTPKDLESARDLAHRDKYQFQWWACSLVNAQPHGGKKKGADRGIDGQIFFQDDPDSSVARKVIVSVKGGEHVSLAQVKELMATVDQEKGSIGLFVTLTPPTNPMKVTAAAAGFYASPNGKDYPKIQILTIEGLLEGNERPRFPDYSVGNLTFKKAKVENATHNQENLL